MKLLFVEDEPVLVEEMDSYFSSQGFVCEQAISFSQAAQKIHNYRYDIVILDITLPDGTGMELISGIREKDIETGILILSAKNSLNDKIDSLNLGADDYLTKPFYIEELSARVNALYRRKILKGSQNIHFDAFTIEPFSKKLSYKKQEIGLTRKEFEMLMYFLVNKERVVSKSAIAEHLWGDNFDQQDNFDTVYVHMKNLRKKLNSASGKDYIRTVYGMGYKFSC